MIRTTLRWAAAFLGIGWAATVLWLRPVAADDAALAVLVSGDGVTVSDSRSQLILQPTAGGTDEVGFVVYPGALVDPRAYAALFRPLAAEGHPVVVVKFPFDLAFAGAGLFEQSHDAVDGDRRWILAGHSLGGAVGAGTAADQQAAGLALLGAYPITDLSASSLTVSSIYGTNDGLATPDDIDDSRVNLPVDTVFVPIEGGIHSFFADYGPQPGDGEPDIGRAEAQEQIRGALRDLAVRASG